MAWLLGWMHREKITTQFANVDGALTDFAVLVQLTADADYSDALATGADIRFTQSDGTTLLKHEMESWSGGGGGAVTACFWVKLPSISAVAGTDFYIYWEKAGAPDGQDAANTWKGGYSAVYHLGTGLTDSSGNANNLTNSGTADAAGKIARGRDCETGDPDYMFAGDSASLDAVSTGDATFLCLFKPESVGIVQTFMGKYDGSVQCFNCIVDAAKKPAFFHDNGPNNETQTAGSAIVFNAGTWYMLGWRIDGSTLTYWYNGAAHDTDTLAHARAANNGNLTVAAGHAIAGTMLDGVLDETRLYDGVLSNAELKFTYHNIFEGDNELGWGGKETAGLEFFPHHVRRHDNLMGRKHNSLIGR